MGFTSDQTAALLQLLFEWQGLQTPDGPDAAKFATWLVERGIDAELLAECTPEAIGEFFEANHLTLCHVRDVQTQGSCPDDSRNAPRFRLACHAFLVVRDTSEAPESTGEATHAFVTDVSEMGVGLETMAELAPGSLVDLTLATPTPPLAFYRLQAEVRWSAGDAGRVHTGMRFIEGADLETWRAEYFQRFVPR